jgi:hypothetical protein
VVEFEGQVLALLSSKARGHRVKLSVFPPRFTPRRFATMALDKSAIADLLDALRAGGDLDIIREGWPWSCRH